MTDNSRCKVYTIQHSYFHLTLVQFEDKLKLRIKFTEEIVLLFSSIFLRQLSADLPYKSADDRN